jgi:hypothetical protein
MSKCVLKIFKFRRDVHFIVLKRSLFRFWSYLFLLRSPLKYPSPIIFIYAHGYLNSSIIFCKMISWANKVGQRERIYSLFIRWTEPDSLTLWPKFIKKILPFTLPLPIRSKACRTARKYLSWIIMTANGGNHLQSYNKSPPLENALSRGYRAQKSKYFVTNSG